MKTQINQVKFDIFTRMHLNIKLAVLTGTAVVPVSACL